MQELVMIVTDIRTLIDKLNPACQAALQNAVGWCVTSGNYELTFEHLLLSLLDSPDTDLFAILRHENIDSASLKAALQHEVEGFPRGNTSKPSFSPQLISILESAWTLASLRFKLDLIRSGVLIVAALDEMKRSMAPYATLLSTIDESKLKNELLTIVAPSAETQRRATTQSGGAEVSPQNKGELEKYCRNLTADAAAGKIDPILGRDSEIYQVIDILSRRRKNNPILVGEAGVGKTSILEGLALQIAAGDVPATLRGVELWELDLGLLQAGASVKGEFEKRLKTVIDIAKNSAGKIILFIDEAHTLIGAGGAAGMGDAANLLKPALARGELRTCAATTWMEYRKYFEKDPALTRRFQIVKVEEPDEDKCAAILRGIAQTYERHHGVHISEEGIKTAVSFSNRYISGRQLPDKAVDVLDTACTRVKMSRTTSPIAIEYRRKTLIDIERSLETLNRDRTAGISDNASERLRLQQHHDATRLEIEELTDKWEREKVLVEQIVEHQQRLLAASDSDATVAQSRSELERLNGELQLVAGESPLVYPHVSGSICAQVIADWTGIPVGSLLKNEASVLLSLEQLLAERVKGQDAAVNQIAAAVRSAKTGMTNPDAPLGVFLCTGPSGVGKTECALALADLLFGGEKFSTVINMSEYQEKHTVSQLKGSPPGYVGYGEGGVLTEAVRQKPYSIIILDEVEKAHRDVLNMFYQVFDKGYMRDGEGRDINFRNTVILMTSNLGSDTLIQAFQEGISDPAQLTEYIRPELTEHFQAALLARCKIIPFLPLPTEVLDEVVRLKLDKVKKRLFVAHQIPCFYSDAVVNAITAQCSTVEAGARNIDVIINTYLLPRISQHLLTQIGEQKDEQNDEQRPSLSVDIDESGDFCLTFEQPAQLV
jgi:type VI secretion system protein VasG